MSFVIESPYGQLLYDEFPPAAQNDALAIFCDAWGSMFDPVYTLVAEQGTDGDDDYVPGWGSLFDVTKCPTADLPYLGQFVGVSIPDGTDDATARALIQAEAGMHRGTPASIRSAIERNISTVWQPNTAYASGVIVSYAATPGSPVYYLTTSSFTSGATFATTNLTEIAITSQYQLYERSTSTLAADAYQIAVVVNTAQLTPSGNSTALLAAIDAVKPAGILVNIIGGVAGAPLLAQYTRNFSAITAQLAVAQLADVT
jgi:hypothetical protein